MAKDMAKNTKQPKLPGFYMLVKDQYPVLVDAYESFAKASETAGPLTRREQRLVKLGLAFGARMEGASHAAVRKALEAGLNSKEIEHAALLAMTTTGFPNAMANLGWVKDVLAKNASQSKAPAANPHFSPTLRGGARKAR